MTTALSKLTEARGGTGVEAQFVEADLLRVRPKEFDIRLVWSLRVSRDADLAYTLNKIHSEGFDILRRHSESVAYDVVAELHKRGSEDDESRDFADNFQGNVVTDAYAELTVNSIRFVIDVTVRHSIPVPTADVEAAFSEFQKAAGV